MFSALILAFIALPMRHAAADDETDDTNVTIHAIDCTGTPPTITVLGLTIDVSAATFGSGNGEDDQGEDDADQPSPVGCAALVVGNNVEVRLASDGTPLAATQVDDQGSEDGDQEVSIEGPLQAVDTAVPTVQILGLTVNVGSATSDDDASDDGDSQPLDLSTYRRKYDNVFSCQP